MFTTLYSVLKPLISGAVSGIITVVSEYGSQGTIYLMGGRLVGAETENLTGAAAADELTKWVSISTEFAVGKEDILENPDVFDHKGFVELLAERAKMITAIRKVITGNDAKFKILVDDWDDKSLSLQQTMLITNLDGRHSVRQVVAESGLAELEVLKFIHYLYTKGLVKEVNATKAMKKEDIDHFLEVLRKKLLDLVGPAADDIIQKAFDALGIKPDRLTRSQIASVFDSVAEQLEEIESEVFKHWKIRYYKELSKTA